MTGEHPDTPPAASTARSVRAWAVLTTTIALALFADLFSKWLAFRRLAGQPVVVQRDRVLALPNSQINELIPPHEATVVVPHVLELKLVLNPGAVFGFGAGGRWFFAAFTLFAIAFAVWMFARWTRPRETLAHIAIGLIIAGGLGNLYDRMVYACVRDFLHPLYSAHFPGGRPLWPYVSNVADAFLIVGIAVLMVYLWRSGEPKAPESPRPTE